MKANLRRFYKNKSALAGVIIILIACFVALSGYLITTDKSEDANTQLTGIALKKPGFECYILTVKNDRKQESQSFLSKMFFGDRSNKTEIPALDYRVSNDTIYYTSFPLRKKEDGSYFQKSLHVEGKNPADHISKRTFWFGTDKFGRCIYSRMVIGIRISLMVGLLAVAISIFVGTALGAIAGFFGGRTDRIIMLLTQTIWSIPTILLVFAVVLSLGRGIGIIFLAVGLTMWVDVARLVRGQILSVKKLNFIDACRSMGFSDSRIIIKHILPNIMGPITVLTASNFAQAILLEAGLSYLGFGIQPPKPSLGNILNENYIFALSGKPFLALAPSLAIMLLVLAFNLLGNGFRDALDVKEKVN